MFKVCKANLKQLKRNVVEILNECQMDKVARKVGEAARDSFSIKLFLKDHKPTLPHWVVVNDNKTRNKVVSTFLSNSLLSNELTSPIDIGNSEELVSCVTSFHQYMCEVMSLDIKDILFLPSNIASLKL